MRVADILHSQGYSLQSNQKVIEGDNNPDRNGQFILINNKTKLFIKYGQPVISVDTKKKELVGNFRNGGREYHLKGNPLKVLVHDFKIKGVVSRKCCNFVAALYPTIITLRPSLNTFYLLPTPHLYLS